MYLFISIVFIYLVSLDEVITQKRTTYENTLERTRTSIADRWIWGVAHPITYTTEKQSTDVTTHQSRFQLTTAAPVARTKLYDYEFDICEPYNPPMPDFSANNRRISEIQCKELIWKSELMAEQEKRKERCWLIPKFTNYFASITFVMLKSDLCFLETGQSHVGDISLEGDRYGSNGDYFLGGTPALPYQFPHMAAVGWMTVKGGNLEFKCGSFLVSANFVITAAHCTGASEGDVHLKYPYPKIIRIGHENLSSGTFGYDRRVDIYILRIIKHPKYKPPMKYNDIALMKLAKEVTYSASILPACLWVSADTSALGNLVTVPGWGVLEEGSLDISMQLQAGELSLVDNEKCDELLKPFCNRNWCGVDRSQICASNLTGGIDACQGDSGGPLQVKIPAKTEWNFYYVMGVTSFGIGCGRPNIPGVYTRVSSFIDWIESIVWPGNNVNRTYNITD